MITKNKKAIYINVPVELMKKVRHRAIDEGKTTTTWIQEAIEHLLNFSEAAEEIFEQKQESKEKVDIFGNVSKMPSVAPENTN